MRRITESCKEFNNFARWSGNKNDPWNGDYIFSAETCGEEIGILYEQTFKEDDDYIPLLRDKFGRITPPGNNLQLRECGHFSYSTIETQEEVSRKRHPRLWAKLEPFQRKAVEDIESAEFSAYCVFDTGVGKTVISSSVLRENFEKMTPALIICEAGDVYRWQQELIKWLGGHEFMAAGEIEEGLARTPQILDKKGTKFHISPVVITSWTNISNDSFRRWLFDHKFQTMISDESQMFKDDNSSRTQGFIEAAKEIPNKIFLSATWLENKILEAFVPLNILLPQWFPGKRSLLRYCIQSRSGKSYSLDPFYRDIFLERIKGKVFRITKEQAGLKFPKKFSMHEGNREPIWYDVFHFKSNKGFIEEYDEALDGLEKELQSSKPSIGTIIGFMSSLRHITGKMKVMTCVEHVMLWLMQHENEKICIGVHHKSVMDWIEMLLTKAGHEVLTMSDEQPKIKDQIEKEWKTNPKKRILIASILGAGKGRNFQFCRYAICLERQWNKSKELQFEGRFHRVMVDENDNIRTEFTDEDNVYIDYIMGVGTFDTYFHELVNLKGVIVESADQSIDDAPEADFVFSLAKKMISERVRHIGV